MGTANARSVATRLYRAYRGHATAPVDLKFKILLSPLERPFLLEKRIGLSSGNCRPLVAWNYFTSRGLYTRHVSQLASNEAKRVVLVDTLALARKLEAQGFTINQAEAITAEMTDVLNDCLESVARSFVSKSDLQKSDMLQEAALSKLRADVQSSQENKVSIIQRETEKLRTDIEKLRSEMRYEMDKVSAGQRLDLNLERGRMREELANQNAETSNLTNKLNKEIHALKTQLEASKYEVIKYCIGTIVSVIALGLGLLRVFK